MVTIVDNNDASLIQGSHASYLRNVEAMSTNIDSNNSQGLVRFMEYMYLFTCPWRVHCLNDHEYSL